MIKPLNFGAWFQKARFVARVASCGLAALLCNSAMFAGEPGATPQPGVNTNINVKSIPDTAEYHIQPLDTLQITVFQEPDLTQQVKVSQQGNISHPLLGSVQLSGLTVADAEKKLTDLLGKDYLVNPRVTITMGSNSARRVIVLGQVKSPGSYELSSDESLTLLQAIAKSGGFTDLAASGRIAILRSENGKEQKIVVDVSAIMKGRDKNKDIKLLPGDIVSVPETIF